MDSSYYLKMSEDYKPHTRPATFYDAFIWTLDFMMRNCLYTGLSFIVTGGGAAVLGNAMRHNDPEGAAAGGIVILLGLASFGYQIHKAGQPPEWSPLRDTRYQQEKDLLDDPRIIEGQFSDLDNQHDGDYRQLSPPE